MNDASALDDMTVFRDYEQCELGGDGYPHAWHGCCGETEHNPRGGIKDRVRAAAGERCQRCGHPYIVGAGIYGEAVDEAQAFDLYPQGGGAGAMRLWLDVEPPHAMVGQQRPVNWSPCDERCTHRGPLRCIVDGRVAWQDDGSPATKAPAEYGIDARTRYEAAWRILTVHHLNERKHDLRWWNLAALCQRCHLTIQRKVTLEDPWPWEHSEWFRPHAAAWYALRYLGEHLTYTATLGRLDELLALGRDEEQVERMAL